MMNDRNGKGHKLEDIYISGQISGLKSFSFALEGDEVLSFEEVKYLLQRCIKELERGLHLRRGVH